MAVKIPPQAIIGLVITILIVLIFFAVIVPMLTGEETRTWSTIADEINDMCAAKAGETREFNVFMPDSRGSTSLNLIFFYLAYDNGNFMLARRTYGVENNDYVVNFVDWVRGKEGNKVIRETMLKNCEDVQVCGQFDSKVICNKFQFESNEGSESLSITLTKTSSKALVISYTKQTVCGDNKCCGSEGDTSNAIEYCERDCDEGQECQTLTV